MQLNVIILPNVVVSKFSDSIFFIVWQNHFESLQLIGDWFGVGPWLYCTIFESFPCGDVGVDKLAE